MQKRIWVVGIFLLTLILVIAGISTRGEGKPVQAQLVSAAAPADTSGFARADGPRLLAFPADYGPHPDFQTEWWYYTGNLEAEGRQHFGYQLTFFRRALLPPTDHLQRPSDWGSSQVYMAHFALTDVSAGRYQAFERLQRGAAGLAGAQAAPFQVWLEDWSVVETAPNVYHLHATQGNLQLDLTLTDTGGPVLQGDQGYSQKGPQPGQASYYYSLPHLASYGTVQVGQSTHTVHGLSWMDHEFSTSALADDQVGWDWFSIQLSDGSELMFFQIRKSDGSLDPFSSGTWIGQNGEIRHLSLSDFKIQALGTWKSPHSGATYPARWSVKVPQLDLDLQIDPWLADQELNVSYSYWEGAVRVKGQHQGQPVTGNGYVELTGYSGSMNGQF
jgi:predicted secreted hydrolase